jgi:DNA-binding transcriptional LysR family regulator
MKKLNIRKIEVFKAIMDMGTITAAGKFLNVTQPSISKHLKLLEENMELALFKRSGNKLQPTPEGMALYDQIERVYAGMDNLQIFAESLKHHRHGEIIVASMPLIAQRWMPRQVAQFLQEHEDISMSLPVRSSRWITKALAARRIDVGIALHFTNEPEIEMTPLLNSPIVCAMHAEHRLAGKKVISPDDLQDECVITLNNFDRWRLNIERVFEDHNVQPHRRVDTFTTHVACELALNGIGVALIDTLTAMDCQDPNLKICRFEPTTEFNICVMTPRHWPVSRISQRLIDHLMKAAKQTEQNMSVLLA